MYYLMVNILQVVEDQSLKNYRNKTNNTKRYDYKRKKVQSRTGKFVQTFKLSKYLCGGYPSYTGIESLLVNLLIIVCISVPT